MAVQPILQHQWNACASVASGRRAARERRSADLPAAPLLYLCNPPKSTPLHPLASFSHFLDSPPLPNTSCAWKCIRLQSSQRLQKVRGWARCSASSHDVPESRPEGDFVQEEVGPVAGPSDGSETGPVEVEKSERTEVPPSSEEPSTSDSDASAAPFAWVSMPGSWVKAALNAEWLQKPWAVPWSPETALLVAFGLQLLAGVAGRLTAGVLYRVLGSAVVGSELLRFASRTAAYLTAAMVLELFLASQKKLDENPFEMAPPGRGGRWAQLKWVALWLGFRVLWGGVASRGVRAPGMCAPASSFAIERNAVVECFLGSGAPGEVVGGLGDAATVAIIAQVAAPLNTILDLVVAPWFEQALFRGFLQTSLSSLNPLSAIAVSAACQGMEFMNQHRLCDLQLGMVHPPRLLLRWFVESALAGAVYGFVFQKTRSLLPVVLLQQLETLSKMVSFSYERGPLRVALKMAMSPSTGGH